MNLELRKISDWARNNKLNFNENKSEVMLMSRRKRKEDKEVVGCQPYTPAAFTPMKYSWYSFVLEDESTGRIMSMKNSNDTIWNRTRDLRACSEVPQPTAQLRTAC